MRIVHKLIIAFTISIASLIVVGAWSLVALKDSVNSFDYIAGNSLPSIKVLQGVIEHRERARREVYISLLSKDNNGVETHIKNTYAELEKSVAGLKKYKAELISDDQDNRYTDQNIALFEDYIHVLDSFAGALRSQRLDVALDIVSETGQLTAVSTRLTDVLNKQIQYNYQLAENFRDASHAEFDHTLWLLSFLVIGAAAASLVISFFVLRYIHHALRDFSLRMEDINQSLDLTHRVEVKRHDEIGTAAHSFNLLADKMAGVIHQVKGSSSQVDSAAHEIAISNDDLSSRTESQAASLEETAASMNQLSSTVKNNVDIARHADELMKEVHTLVHGTNSELDELKATIDEIAVSSAKIVEITAIIEGIAFQTNILALNAAVEAARAGEHGKGFAVVAGEVRTLSQRSSGAARDIKALIDTAVEKVNLGVKSTQSVAGKMVQATEAVTETKELINQVSHSSLEQSHGIDQVNIAVNQMEGVLQQNAAMVEEMASAANSLRDQAGKLLADVNAFTVASAGHALQAQPDY